MGPLYAGNDARGPYTFMTGARISSGNALPPGISAIKIPAGRYAVFLTEKGLVGKVVPQAWQRIWSQTEDSPAAHRAFQADFEVYGQRAADPQNAQVEIYVVSVPEEYKETKSPNAQGKNSRS